VIIMSSTRSEGRGGESLYHWAFRVGSLMYECLSEKYEEDGARKRLKNVILNLRSESLPSKFRRELINAIIEVIGDERSVCTTDEMRGEEPWKVDEFYRYSTAILAGMYDALQSKMRKKEEKKEGGKKCPSALS